MMRPPIDPPNAVNMYNILDRHQHCFYCSLRTREQSERSRDHVTPRSRGGRRKVNCCRPCNRAKGACDLEEFRAYRYGGKRVEFYGEWLYRMWESAKLGVLPHWLEVYERMTGRAEAR